MNAECPHLREVNAFIAGEMEDREHAAFSAHLLGCAECSAAEESARRLVSRLTSAPDVECQHDLVPSILARVRQSEAAAFPPWQKRVAAIAAVFLFGAVGLAMLRQGNGMRSSLASATASESNKHALEALDWFVRNQEPDGSWSAERWGGQRHYAPALTALPLLALTASEGRTSTRDTAVHRAAASLLRQQNADGTFGPVFQGAPYNNSISTLALLHTWQRDQSAVPKEALDKAVAALVANQTGAGAWGYRLVPFGDRSITQWHVQALEAAGRFGWEIATASSERGVNWLSRHTAAVSSESEEPPDSTSAILARSSNRPFRGDGSLDFYHSYFTAAALKHEGGSAAGERLATLQREILRHQIRVGEESGSWPPDDQWGRAGGRLYSTALASLSLSSR